MNKILYLLMCISLLVISYSCTDDFDDTNKNPNKIYDVQPEYVFPGIVYKSMLALNKMNYRLFGTFSQYTVSWVEQKDTENMSGYFEDLYVKVLKDLKKLEENYVGKEGFENVGSILMTWKAYMYYVMVSSWGGIPMSEATPVGTVKSTYKYDTQKEVYAEILSLLDKAVDTFNVNGDKFIRDAVFRTGNSTSDIARWRKFANSLRLSIALNIQTVNSELAEQHIRKALSEGNENYLISSINDIASFKYGADINADASYYYGNFLYQFDTGTNTNWSVYPAMSHNFFLYMKSYNDPRLSKFVQRASYNDMPIINNDTLTRVNSIDASLRDSIIVRYGLPYVPRRDFKAEPTGWIVGTNPESVTGERYRSPYSDISIFNGKECLVSRDYLKSDAEIVMLSWAEVCFMKAEAAIKYSGLSSGSAQQCYEEGIRASMKQYGVSDAEIATYMNQPGVKWNTNGDGYWEYRHFYKADIKGEGDDSNHLEQIYKQWYISNFFNGHAGWTLERRTRAVNFPPHFYNGSASEGSNGVCDYMQERLIYPIDEQKYNTVGYQQALVDLQLESPAPNPTHNGDNFFTLLQFAAQQPDGGNLSKWLEGTIIYDGRFIRNWYGKTLEEVFQTVGVTSEAELRTAIKYEVTAIRSTYDPSTGILYVYNESTGAYEPKI